jgi:hypothetical protein
MGNGIRQQCAGTTKSGDRCKRKAYKDTKHCGIHGGKEEGAEQAESRARATTPTESEYHPDFQKALKVCETEGENPSDNSTKVQWMQIRLRVIIAAREDLRRTADSGARPINVVIGINPPDKPRPT